MMTPNQPRGQIVTFLREADFGAPLELVLRYTLVGTLGVAVWIYSDDPLVGLWLASYAGTETIYYRAVRPRRRPLSRKDDRNALACYAMTAAAFVSMPIYLTHMENPLLSAAAVLAQLGMLIYMLWRPHLVPAVSYFDGVIIVAFAANTILAFWDRMPDPPSRVIFAAITASVALYAIMALIRALRQLQENQKFTERSRESEKMEAVARLTGGIAHDFNNLLTVVLGNMELYWHTPPGPERDALIREATDAAHRGAHLTSQLLAYSRKAPMKPQADSLRAHVETTLPLIKRLLPERIPLRIDIVRNAGNVAVDSTQFTTALMNLVSNAADAIGEKDGAITISGWPLMGPNGQKSVVLSVSDRGGGIAEGVEARVTEPFFTTKPVGQGSGLGLSMVKGFAEQSGGRMELHNRPGEGLTVTLVLPYVAPASCGAQMPPAPAAANLNTATEPVQARPDTAADLRA